MWDKELLWSVVSFFLQGSFPSRVVLDVHWISVSSKQGYFIESCRLYELELVHLEKLVCSLVIYNHVSLVRTNWGISGNEQTHSARHR